jgi:hypothetical protein
MHVPEIIFGKRRDAVSNGQSVRESSNERYDTDKPLLHEIVKDKKIKEVSFALWANGAELIDGYGNAGYICPKCMRIHEKFFYTLRSPEGEYQPSYRCSSCSIKLLRITEKESMLWHDNEEGKSEIECEGGVVLKWKCRKCGGETLALLGGVGFWD